MILGTEPTASLCSLERVVRRAVTRSRATISPPPKHHEDQEHRRTSEQSMDETGCKGMCLRRCNVFEQAREKTEDNSTREHEKQETDNRQVRQHGLKWEKLARLTDSSSATGSGGVKLDSLRGRGRRCLFAGARG